jgi:hypothetical protein
MFNPGADTGLMGVGGESFWAPIGLENIAGDGVMSASPRAAAGNGGRLLCQTTLPPALPTAKPKAPMDFDRQKQSQP